MCAVRKADTHTCLRAASSEGLGVGAQVAAVSTSECGRDELGPEQRADHGPWYGQPSTKELMLSNCGAREDS